jgi:hypothetical protein
MGASSADPEPSPAASPTLDLSEMLPADAKLVGVAITPDGTRYVLDQRSGLYRIDEGAAHLVFNTSGLSGLELTDVVALSDFRLAVTAENDGFLLDLLQGSLESYFCYLPSPPAPPSGGTEPEVPLSVSQTLQLSGVPVAQRTEAVAYASSSGQLFAQPRTRRLDTGEVVGSELFIFDQAGGEPFRVLPFETAFVAGGMAAIGGRLLLGSGSSLYEAAIDGGLTRVYGVDAAVEISGMARAPDGALWLLDGQSRRLLKLEPEIQLW